MTRKVSASTLLVLVACCSCATLDHYEADEIVRLADNERDILFGHVETTTVVLQQLVRKYAYKPVQWSGVVSDVVDTGSPIWPLRVVVDVRGRSGQSATRCVACFAGKARGHVANLQKGDAVTVVGAVGDFVPGSPEFLACELVRAERNGKQIYPPPEEQKDDKGGKKP